MAIVTNRLYQGHAFTVKCYVVKAGETSKDFTGATLQIRYLTPDGTVGTVSASESTLNSRQTIEGEITEAINTTSVTAGTWTFMAWVTMPTYTVPVPGWEQTVEVEEVPT